MNIIEQEAKKKQAHEELYAPLAKEPLNLDEIFSVMIEALHHQYIGFPYKKQYYTPSEYRTYILSRFRFNKLTVQTLARSLHQFTADMHDRHLVFHCDDWIDYRNTDPRFHVRAQQDCLWVTEAAAETGLVPGDKILSLNQMTPDRIRSYMRGNAFNSAEPERELWGGYLRMAEHAEVMHADGSTDVIRLKQFAPEDPAACQATKPAVLFRKLSPAITCLEIRRLEEHALQQILSEHEADIKDCKKLILDLRRCDRGDSAEAGLALVPYLTDREITLAELLADQGAYVNCTKVNCSLRYQILTDYLETLSEPEERRVILEERKFYAENAGKGICYREPERIEDRVFQPGVDAPEQIVILTDTFTENEGEEFVQMCMRCGSKVHVIGRPTMGSLDFFDPITVSLNEHMSLSYPIAMTAAAYQGHGISEKGLEVEQYIPWTPEEIDKDLLLIRGMEL